MVDQDRVSQIRLLLQKEYDLIGDVRGIGLFFDIELVRDYNTLQPASSEASAVINALRNHRFLTGTDGPYDNVIKIKPLLVIAREDVTRTIECLEQVLTHTRSDNSGSY